MLGVVLGAIVSVIEADNFAVPRWIFHEAMTLLGSIGSA